MKHLLSHSDNEPDSFKCLICPFFFQDSLALEKHCILSGHLQTAQYNCDRCPNTFSTQREYNRHREFGQSCCDAFHSTEQKEKHCPGYIDPDEPNSISKEVPDLAYGGDSTDARSDMSDDGVYCRDCKKTFVSGFSYTRHILGCSALNSGSTLDSSPDTLLAQDQSRNDAPASLTAKRHTAIIEVPTPRVMKSTTLADATQPVPLKATMLEVTAPVSPQSLSPPNVPKNPSSINNSTKPIPRQLSASTQAHVTQSAVMIAFACNINGCQRSYNSEPGLRIHQTDAHGFGGRGLDLHGRDSWMLGQRERERIRTEGLPKAHRGSARGGGRNRGGSRGGRVAPVSAGPAPMRAPLPAVPTQLASNTHDPCRQASSHHSSLNTNLPSAASRVVGGALEMEQAKSICGKMLPLLLQSDIFIHHDGKLSVNGIDWTRIGVERQSAAVEMFDEMCHLPRRLQSLEYVPAPKTFMAEYTAQYPVKEFASAPIRNSAELSLSVIALACSKVVLNNGCHEIVKIAAVDVLSCRVLMSHLVCTDPNAQVSNWCSSTTGLKSFKDMEDARQAGYKVLNGWAAARSALFKFIDQDTVIIGHNLRSDLDALRIIHGRAIDIVKVIEKAAQGPLSKVQVSLDSWCRDVTNIAKLHTNPVFGHDCVMNAFAAREIGLWAIKNREQFVKMARQMTKEYQMVS